MVFVLESVKNKKKEKHPARELSYYESISGISCCILRDSVAIPSTGSKFRELWTRDVGGPRVPQYYGVPGRVQ